MRLISIDYVFQREKDTESMIFEIYGANKSVGKGENYLEIDFTPLELEDYFMIYSDGVNKSYAW